MSTTKNTANGLIHWTPSDSTFITDQNGTPKTAAGFLIGGDGVLRVTWGNGRVDTVPASTFNTGEVHWIEVKKIWATDTTATNIYLAVDFRV